MGNHTETIQIDYNPRLLTYEQILQHFWKQHNPLRYGYKGRQYISLILVRNEQQRELASRSKEATELFLGEKVYTEIEFLHSFYLAEDKHQKYYLKRYQKAYTKLLDIFPSHAEFIHSTLVARLNGFVRGLGNIQELKLEFNSWGVGEQECKELSKFIDSLKW